ncbi:hypothetical protein [Actinokineospora fastidiosa]|uniref:hypothetical protein n=1 Tax=Actinokineospora fastidiosa TaxID=1816 RepID=UPI001E550E77|nr:hypothetical protein [Actinokineospora fastidiosa]
MGAPVVTEAPPEGARSAGLRSVTRTATTTPGRLSVAAVGLVLLTAVTGLFAALTLQDKKDTLDDLVSHREPLAAAAQLIFRSLSDADATAASAFLSGGAEPDELRARYEFDIAQAGAALGKASSDVGADSMAAQQVDILSRQLPVYTGLVETARTNKRQGFPAGAAYLREASGLMRSQILPAAEKLYEINYQRLTSEQEDARSFPWITALLTLALIAALVVTQLWLTRKTNRLINIGLAAATAAVALALIWGTVALLVESTYVRGAERDGSQQVDLLVQARINSLKCRADETLTLVARGDGAAYEKEWAELAPTLAGEGNLLSRAAAAAPTPELAAPITEAVANAEAWVAAHGKIRELDGTGQYQEAVAMAIGDAPDSAAVAFAALDRNLIAALDAGRGEFVAQTSRAANALTGLVPGVVVLAMVAGVGATLGIRARLREYR